jgi:hypothetical protein
MLKNRLDEIPITTGFVPASTTITKQPKIGTSDPPVHVQLDWNIPEHRLAWQMHLRFQGASLLEDVARTHQDNTSMAVLSSLYHMAWDAIYNIFPEFKNYSLIIDVENGIISNNEHKDE